jgi:hypothetical protein
MELFVCCVSSRTLLLCMCGDARLPVTASRVRGRVHTHMARGVCPRGHTRCLPPPSPPPPLHLHPSPRIQVLVEDLPPGPVGIRVSAARIYSPLGPQKYALVVLGAFTGTLASPANPDASSRAADPLCTAPKPGAAGGSGAGASARAGDIPIDMPVFGLNSTGRNPYIGFEGQTSVASPTVDPALPAARIVPPPPSAEQEPGRVSVEIELPNSSSSAAGSSATAVASVETLVEPLGAGRAPVIVDSFASPSSAAPIGLDAPATPDATGRRRLAQAASGTDGNSSSAAESGPYIEGGSGLELGSWTRVPSTTGFTVAGLPPGDFQMQVLIRVPCRGPCAAGDA